MPLEPRGVDIPAGEHRPDCRPCSSSRGYAEGWSDANRCAFERRRYAGDGAFVPTRLPDLPVNLLVMPPLKPRLAKAMTFEAPLAAVGEHGQRSPGGTVSD